MQTIIKKISELVQPEKNIRIHTEKQLKEFEKSIKMFGQIRPIVIDENNTILAGNGLYETLKRMGSESAECYQYPSLTENQKKKLMIADNRIYALGVDNLESMNDILSELAGDFEVPGFEEEMLKQMMADEEEITEVISEYGKLDEEEVAMVRVQAEKKEAAMQKQTESSGLANTQGHPISFTGGDSLQPDGRTPINEEGQEIRKSVTCPKCGERIWL